LRLIKVCFCTLLNYTKPKIIPLNISASNII
jgi:hypothetical protein